MTVSIADVPVRRSIIVNVSAADAFDVFTEDMNSWWPRTHHIGKVPMRRIVVEGRQGGRCYSEHVDGTECDWGRVLTWDPPRRLVLAWQITPEWGYESDVSKSSEVEVTFVPVHHLATRVDVEHRFFDRQGRGGETMRAAVGAPTGWSLVLAQFGDRIGRAEHAEDSPSQ